MQPGTPLVPSYVCGKQALRDLNAACVRNAGVDNDNFRAVYLSTLCTDAPWLSRPDGSPAGTASTLGSRIT